MLPKPFSYEELLGTVNEVLRATAGDREQVESPTDHHGQPLPNGLRL
jgi:DNA-binding response OmpR family regulator